MKPWKEASPVTDYPCCSNCKHFLFKYIRPGEYNEDIYFFCDNKDGYFYQEIKERSDICSEWTPYLGGDSDV